MLMYDSRSEEVRRITHNVPYSGGSRRWVPHCHGIIAFLGLAMDRSLPRWKALSRGRRLSVKGWIIFDLYLVGRQLVLLRPK